MKQGWLPSQIEWRGSEPYVSWCYLGRERLEDPFYDQTIERALRTPFNGLFAHRTHIDVLAQWNAESPGLTPAGFIFHMSRCGSTLVSRMLAALSDHLVVSEAGPLDAMARSGLRAAQISIDKRIEWFRWIVGAAGQPRQGGERKYFIKFDSRTILDLPLIRQAFPNVPWIFLYREPLAVLASHAAEPAPAMVPGILGRGGLNLPQDQLAAMSPAEYGARVLAGICEAACVHLREMDLRDMGPGLAVNYSELPDAVWGRIASHFGLKFTPPEIDSMKNAAAFHAKRPRLRFRPETELARADLPEAFRVEAAKWIAPHYAELERLRSLP